MEFVVGIDEAEEAQGKSTSMGLTLELLGSLRVSRNGDVLVLPSSRKLRGLLAYLGLASRATTRNHLCELLWDTPSDPRGELRWALSKLRGVLDEPGRARVQATGESVRLDMTDIQVDALEIQRAMQAGLATRSVEQLRSLAAKFRGEFLEGLTIERSAPFSAWLLAQRRSLRTARLAILERLTEVLPAGSDETISVLETWIQLAPLERRAHEILLGAFAMRGNLHEGQEHLAATSRLFEAEGQDWRPLGMLWRELRMRSALAPASAHAVAAAVETAPQPRQQDALKALPMVELITMPATELAQPVSASNGTSALRRASVAVMPFTSLNGETRGGLGDALTTDIITRLAKLRSLFVIAEGTALSMQERQWDAGHRLKVEYVVRGAVERDGERVRVVVQLTETNSARIVWTDLFEAGMTELLMVLLDQISGRIANSVSSQIELAERNRAIVKPPQSLDAWEAYHLGLWSMYRFDRAENEKALHYFETAARLAPDFAKPHAGLAFIHCQRSYLDSFESGAEIEQIYRSAVQALRADELDPFAHWAMSVALWAKGQRSQAVMEMQASIALSPNFALGHYSLGYFLAQNGDPQAALMATDHACELSPYDPMRLMADPARAVALLRLGRYEEAADEAVKAPFRPNAHIHSYALASVCLMLAERRDEALAAVAVLRERWPHYRIGDWLAVLALPEPVQKQLRAAAATLGWD